MRRSIRRDLRGLLQALEIADYIIDLRRVEHKLRQRRMAGDNAFGESLNNILDWVPLVQRPKRRCDRQWAGAASETRWR